MKKIMSCLCVAVLLTAFAEDQHKFKDKQRSAMEKTIITNKNNPDLVSQKFLATGTMTLGVNYWPSKTATDMWRKWYPEEIDRDLALLAQNGLKTLRVFPIWRDFQPIYEIHRVGGDHYKRSFETRMFASEEYLPDTPAGYAGVDEKMMERFEQFCDIAQKHGIKLIPCILTGHMTFRLFAPPALEEKNLYNNSYALKWELRFVSYFVKRLKHHPAIIAWESGNESSQLCQAESKEEAEVWLRIIHNAIRLEDPSRPVIGVYGLHADGKSPWQSQMNADLSDFISVHPYNMWSKAGIEEFNSIRNMFYCAAQCSALEQITGKPAFVEEHGLWRSMAVSYNNLAKYQRGVIWNLWAANCRGLLWWCAFDQTQFDIAPYDWKEPALEHGLFSEDRLPHPGAKVFAQFSKFFKETNLVLPPAKPDVQILCGDRDLIHSSYILSRQAGLIPDYKSPESPISSANFYILPSAKARAMLSTRRWEELLKYVHDGATLLLVWDDTYLTHLNKVCGAEVFSRREQGGNMTYQFKDFALTLPCPVKTIFHSLSADILAKDTEGNPCLFRNQYGKGMVYTLTFPLEKLLYNSVGLYDTPAWKIYASIFSVSRLVSANSPYVNVSEHKFSDTEAMMILVNNSLTPFSGKLTVANNWRIVSAKTDSPKDANYKDGVLFLDGNAGILLTLKQD